MAKKTAASEVAKVAETPNVKPSDAETWNTCPGESMFGAPKEVGTETLPQLPEKEVEPLLKAPSGAEVSITRLSASPNRVNSERLEAIDSTNSVPGYFTTRRTHAPTVAMCGSISYRPSEEARNYRKSRKLRSEDPGSGDRI